MENTYLFIGEYGCWQMTGHNEIEPTTIRERIRSEPGASMSHSPWSYIPAGQSARTLLLNINTPIACFADALDRAWFMSNRPSRAGSGRASSPVPAQAAATAPLARGWPSHYCRNDIWWPSRSPSGVGPADSASSSSCLRCSSRERSSSAPINLQTSSRAASATPLSPSNIGLHTR